MTRSVLPSWLVAAAVAAALACGGGAVSNYDYAAEPNPLATGAEFVIGVGDRLQITVWQNPNLSTEIAVRPDGTITMPLVGDLHAAGKTPSQLRAEIAAKLSQYIKEDTAVVTVAVTEVNSYRFSVVGEVARPGVFGERRYVTVVEALALAGGFTRFASRDKITVLRKDKSGTVRKIPIDYDAIARGERPDMNIVVLAGDQIVVP